MSESKKFEKIITELKELTLFDLVQLISTMEETFGINIAAGISPVVSEKPSTQTTTAEVAEEKSTFDITLTDVPADKKIAILKVVRNVTGLGLKESKDIVDNIPKLLKEGASKEESEKIKKEVESAGGKVIIK